MANTGKRLRFFSSLILPLSIVLCLAPATAQEDANAHFAKGKAAFDAKNYEEALAEMQKVVELMPNEPLGHSGVAASLNELKRYPEAKKSLQEAFRLLRAQRNTIYTAFNPIDIYYYALMADIQVNLHEFADAVQTLSEYPLQRMKEADKPAALKAVVAPKAALRAKLVTIGVECLDEGDTACARGALAQADAIAPTAPETLLRIARASLSQAETASSATDEDKARKTELFRMAIEYCGRLPEPDKSAPEAQRVLARALSGTKDEQDYQRAVQILSSMSDSSAQLDLAAVYSNHEAWDQAVKASTKYLESSPKDPRAGYCRRSYAHFKMKSCQQAIEDGAKCTNPDGTPKQLAYIDYCKAELARLTVVDTAGREEALKNECLHLRNLVDYAMSIDVPITDVADVIASLEAKKTKCKAYLGTASAAELCRNNVGTARNPLNLSMMNQEELKTLHDKTQAFLRLCSGYLDEAQKTGVSGAIRTIASKLTP